MQPALDFKEESDALLALVGNLEPADFERRTLFKSWTVNDVIGHLHLFNHAAGLSLADETAFGHFRETLSPHLAVPDGMRLYTEGWLADLRGPALLQAWRDGYEALSEAFAAAGPKRRLQWFGPDMSVLSSVTARLMETWAHGQAVYDLLGRDRVEHDRIRNIAHLGVATFGWSFINRGLEPPGPPPHVRLTAPSGALWEWHAPAPEGAAAGGQIGENPVDGTVDKAGKSAVAGDAAEFCQVVAQTRNVADTALIVSGEAARRWMAIAQCFAGPPETPPAPGSRHRQARPGM